MSESKASPAANSGFDALMPPEMAKKAENIGVNKSNTGSPNLFLLAILAGAFISLGAIFATVATTGAGALPYGITKIIGGLAFCIGLILVVVAGAELFTGNNLIVMAWAGRHVGTRSLLKNWALVYLGNFIGSISTAVIMLFTKQYLNAGGAIGHQILNIANGKCNLEWGQALALGIMCNALVCMAVWLCYSARSTTDKIVSIIFPITAFVAAGFEHCIANMYFIPMGILVKAAAPQSFWAAIGKTPADYANLTWGHFFGANLVPVTLGNIIGGSVLVGMIYWFVYLRKSSKIKNRFSFR